MVPMRPMTTDLSRGELRPYFLWNEDLSIDELRQRLSGAGEQERLRLMAILLREARDIDVWEFVTPTAVAKVFPQIRHRLGRRREFWQWLLDGWREDGYLEV